MGCSYFGCFSVFNVITSTHISRFNDYHLRTPKGGSNFHDATIIYPAKLCILRALGIGMFQLIYLSSGKG